MPVYENSRYLHTEIQDYKGVSVLGIRDRFSFNSENCIMHHWVSGDTLDGVAFKYYNNTALRWAILEANTQYRSEFDIQDGDLILIPDYDEVVNIVNVR